MDSSDGAPLQVRCRWLPCLLPWITVLLLHTVAGAQTRQEGPGYRCIPLKVPATGHAGFTLMDARQTGIDFTNTLSEQNAAQNQIRLNGSGVALGDVDGDGLCDIFLCSLEGHVALYKNLGGWRFTNITAAAGLDFPGNFSTGATFADVDGNGTLDLLINGIGTGTRLFLNDGHGHFTEARDSGLLHEYGAMTCALADIDGDGALDLYVANYRTTTVRTTGFVLLNMGGRRMIRPQDRGRLDSPLKGGCSSMASRTCSTETTATDISPRSRGPTGRSWTRRVTCSRRRRAIGV